ncbi:hypothetical protein C491_08869 [Natronococcus amylolyticus DSM 10524]|uniref:DUF8048 domain-containing protein n=1 Tax=Natronococcus amylolyticus DSM 10524 TaxID=1227497 RepID=L9X9Q2_9EURY|nr:hypothetical protein [Natronococcus amylolyticus]ELY58435.1 hypothetical protein C491_08869 [Natronococcus amylolyticus DSM 10524]
MKLTANETVRFDEFARACDLVAAYFGETIDAVALETPVSRPQLVAVLARVQLSGRQSAIDGTLPDRDVCYHSNDETVLRLGPGFWAEIQEHHSLEAAERRAARDVHRRLLEAIVGEPSATNREKEPLVLIERFERNG